MEALFRRYFRFLLQVSELIGILFRPVGRKRFVLETTTAVLKLLPIYLPYTCCIYFTMQGYWEIRYNQSSLVTKSGDSTAIMTGLLNIILRISMGIRNRHKNVVFMRKIDEINRELKLESASNINKWTVMLILAEVGNLSRDLYTVFHNCGIMCVALHVSTGFNTYLTIWECVFFHVILKEIRLQLVKTNGQLRQEAAFCKNRKVGNLDKVKQIERVSYVMELQNEIIGTAKFINGAFDVRLLISCISNLSVFVISVYYFTRQLFNAYHRMQRGYIDPLFIVQTIIWCVGTLLYFYLAIKNWYDVANEANKTSTYIHDIWNTHASQGQVDLYVNHLQLVSLRLFNRQLNFTVCGLFPLDWTLLQAIIATVTTYVIIMIQFESLNH